MIVLTNDDGIDAPGLQALQQALGDVPSLIVAPLHPMSECSHCVTTKKPLRVEARGTPDSPMFAVDGTPADCVRVALLHLLPQLFPPIAATRHQLRVFSGINQGGNLGADVYISGTVAAVREAAFFGVPGIAFSQYRRGALPPEHWPHAAAMAGRVIHKLHNLSLSPGEFWNVNFPWPLRSNGPEPQIILCDRSRRPLPVKYENIEGELQYVAGLYHTRDFEPGSDIDICFSGDIAVTRMAV
jgi:5'-nucleotidase